MVPGHHVGTAAQILAKNADSRPSPRDQGGKEEGRHDDLLLKALVLFEEYSVDPWTVSQVNSYIIQSVHFL